MVVGTWGNVSCRIDKDNFLITPSGMDYNCLEPEDIVLMDYDLNILEGKYKPSVESPLHSKIYQNRADTYAIVHIHSTYASSFAVARKSIPVVLEETAQVIGHPIEVAPYEHCGTDELAEIVVETLGNDKKAVLLANHGLIALGKDLDEAMKVCIICEKTAKTVLLASQLGTVHVLSDKQIKVLNQAFKSYGQKK